MSAEWDVDEYDDRLEVMGRLTIAVHSPRAELVPGAIESLRRQAYEWDWFRGFGRVTDGRRAFVAFAVRVRAATGAESGAVRAQMGDRIPAMPGRTRHYDADQNYLFGELSNSVRSTPGLNLALVHPGGGVANVMCGCLLVYPGADIGADQNTLDHPLPGTAPGLTGAHEIGHLFGLDERYDREGRNLPRSDQNIMANAEQSHFRELIRWDYATDPPTPVYRIVNRPWIGAHQLADLADAALYAARNASPGESVPPPHRSGTTLAVGLNGARYFGGTYHDRRLHPPSRWGCGW